MATQLVPLPEVERLSASVIRILAGNPGKFTLQGTNTYLIGRGHQRILIDTGQGEPAWVNNLTSVLSSEKATVHHALLTHWHGDHVGGVKDLLRLCPQACVYKCEPDKDEGQVGIVDGQVFSVEGATLKAVFSPGHTEDHMAFVLEEEDAIFTGDSDLHRMRDRVQGRGYPGHGAVMENVNARISEYIKHRKQREDEVVRVLRWGKLDVSPGEQSPEPKRSWTPLQLVKVIYKDVPENLHLPASHGIGLVLHKLEDEGRVVHDSESGEWSLSEKSAL
ncbi:metallo-beta-lactamase domain protein [Penicillium cosmopolitanum]|uniref:Metallo-beta-lactamase domain protein n=1 Tax=Penicillium cosmopolitanum TaxID=1131564 RepID=A0A9W9VXK3_9EURO|nr:metallo-beta-lactamase domain protein [Penicillium cosmopolitanum]KAJ5391239.1 metallo-beta-lactamase domain protein [Penicillium cosmopolitanum]